MRAMLQTAFFILNTRRKNRMNISGKVAIVTGGGSGLGAATARLLTQKGARVAVVD